MKSTNFDISMKMNLLFFAKIDQKPNVKRKNTNIFDSSSFYTIFGLWLLEKKKIQTRDMQSSIISSSFDGIT